MLRTFTNLTKAAIATAVTPITVIADIASLPATAYDNKHPFGNTASAIQAARDAFAEAVRPENRS